MPNGSVSPRRTWLVGRYFASHSCNTCGRSRLQLLHGHCGRDGSHLSAPFDYALSHLIASRQDRSSQEGLRSRFCGIARQLSIPLWGKVSSRVVCLLMPPALRKVLPLLEVAVRWGNEAPYAVSLDPAKSHRVIFNFLSNANALEWNAALERLANCASNRE
jgi:hypothetical protein